MVLSEQGRHTGNLEAGESLLVLELEAQTLGVVVQDLNLGQLQVKPSLVTTLEDLGAVNSSGGLSGGRVVAVETDTDTGDTNGGVDGSQGRLALGRFRGVLAEALG